MPRVLPLIAVFLAAACSQEAPAPATNNETNAPTPAASAPATPQPAAAPGLPAVPQAAEGSAPQAAAAGSGAETPVRPVPARLPEVVARVNGEAIAGAELQRAVASVEGQNGAPVPADQRDRVYRGVLDELIGYRLLLQEALARRFTVNDADVEARIGQIRSQFPSDQLFDQLLAQQRVTLDQLRADTRTELLIARVLLAEVEPKVRVTSEQVADFYRQNPAGFRQGERVRASHILFALPQGADDATKQAARVKAEGVLGDVKAGKDFAALARQHSQDPGSAGDGGDLNYFEREQMVGPFADAAFALAPGQTSGIVETPFGYHIIKITDRQPPRTVPLDEASPQIQEFLTSQVRQQAVQAFVAGLKARANVEILI